ncbi:MAG: hypothetical protein KDJ86_17195 [Bauldia sp.]|uniref:hypothetical protein n=1 Tax=Bauldia sp. TaxID=2575872 RepID=UPI001D1BE22D|nr:hypothetical protein [Bauldia sp.]MCB1497519.1 hypothetical protein [Bauldia sp.]
MKLRNLTNAVGLAGSVLVAFAGTAVADTLRCKAVDAAPTLTIEVASAEGDTLGAVTQVDADLGDFTMSAHPIDAEVPGEKIEDQTREPGLLELSLIDAEDVWIVMRLRLVRDVDYHLLQGDETDEGARSVAAGTLSVMGAGIWAVTCEGW